MVVTGTGRDADLVVTGIGRDADLFFPTHLPAMLKPVHV